MDPLDPHNIRASIKALAKSVHGDPVFGDLPRPRFSTQIWLEKISESTDSPLD